MLAMKPCKFAGDCKRAGCIFYHGNARDHGRSEARDGRDRGRDNHDYATQRPPDDVFAAVAATKMCRYGANCKRGDCFFRHD